VNKGKYLVIPGEEFDKYVKLEDACTELKEKIRVTLTKEEKELLNPELERMYQALEEAA
jgi:hypothetical protein